MRQIQKQKKMTKGLDEKEEGRQGKTNDEFYEELFNEVIAHKKFNKLNNTKE